MQPMSLWAANFSGFEALTSLLLVAVLLIAAYTDIRHGLIYNKLVLPAAGLGLALNTVAYGLDGGLGSVKGWLLGVGLFIIFYLLKAMGAGDVKLLAAVGAIKGMTFVLNTFVFTGLAGGLVAAVVLLQRRRMRFALTTMGLELHNLFFFKQLPQHDDTKKASLGIPYGVAIAIGGLAALFIQL